MAAGEVVVGALVPMLVPVVGLVQVAELLLLLLAAAGAALLLLLLLLAVGAALLLLAADGRGAALHQTESIETKCKNLVTNWSTYS